MIFDSKTSMIAVAVVCLAAQHVIGAPTYTLQAFKPIEKQSLSERDFWDKVGNGWNEFKDGFKDGFNSEQARPLAPEEAGHKRTEISSGTADVKLNNDDDDDDDAKRINEALGTLGIHLSARDAHLLHERGFWDSVGDGLNKFKEGFNDGFDAEQARPLAPEEAGHKRSHEPFKVSPDSSHFAPIGWPQGVHSLAQLVTRDVLDDIGSGIGKGIGSIKGEFTDGIEKIKGTADAVFHPNVAKAVSAEQQKRDSWQDDAGNVAGALVGWGSDHVGRISFRRDDQQGVQARDSWQDDLGNAVGAGAGWVTDHVGRVDPSDLIPSKGAKKAVSSLAGRPVDMSIE